MISVVMASYLGHYKNAAKDRDKKIIRAIYSVLAQTYEDWELLVVADGCMLTKSIVSHFFDSRIKLIFIDKQTTWSGNVRNTGLQKATGDYACYLDVDDLFSPQHLQILSTATETGKDWYWFDDYVWAGSEFIWRKCSVDKLGKCGTSNVLHKPSLAQWKPNGNYAHDWVFIKALQKASKNYSYIGAGQYCVCHIPGRFDI